MQGSIPLGSGGPSRLIGSRPAVLLHAAQLTTCRYCSSSLALCLLSAFTLAQGTKRYYAAALRAEQGVQDTIRHRLSHCATSSLQNVQVTSLATAAAHSLTTRHLMLSPERPNTENHPIYTYEHISNAHQYTHNTTSAHHISKAATRYLTRPGSTLLHTLQYLCACTLACHASLTCVHAHPHAQQMPCLGNAVR